MAELNFEKQELFTPCDCQKVLPLAYDNSLSYYEAICKLTAKVNELIDIINEMENPTNDESK